MEEKIYLIYLYTFPNGKYYVGQTYKGSGRLNSKENYRTSKVVYKAMKKYKYKKEILEDNLTSEEANEREIYYIKKYDSLVHHNGYNVSEGGTTIKKGNIPWNKGIHTGYTAWNKGLKEKDYMSEENQKKSKANLINNDPEKLKEWSKKYSFKKGNIPTNRKKVIFINELTKEEIIFESVTSASKFLGYASDKSMSKRINKNSLIKGIYRIKYLGKEDFGAYEQL